MLHVFMNDLSFYKSVKYSYFWSFLEFGEENKMCLKLNFTAHKYCDPTPNSKGGKLQPITSCKQTFGK